MCVDAAGSPGRVPLVGEPPLPRRRHGALRASATAGRCSTTAAATSPDSPRTEVVELARRSALLLNVMGYLDDEELLAAAPLRAFLDIDPGFGQMWTAARPRAAVRRATTATSPSAAGSASPTARSPPAGSTGSRTLPPVELSRVAARRRAGRALHQRGQLAGAVRTDRVRGTHLRPAGARVPTLRRAAATRRAAGSSSRSTSTTPTTPTGDGSTREGWALVDPRAAAGDPWRYRDYVQRLLGRADDREEPVRRHAQRLVQRPQRLLPGERPPGARPGHRARGSAPGGRRPGGVQRRSTRPRQGPRRSSATTHDHSRAARELAEEHLAAEPRAAAAARRSWGSR